MSSLFGSGTLSKMALILKQKEDGSTKRRIILDLRRSGGNDKCVVDERLPADTTKVVRCAGNVETHEDAGEGVGRVP